MQERGGVQLSDKEIVKITVVVNYASGERVSEIANWHKTLSQYVYLAKGTASKAILRQLGISDSRKEIITITAVKPEADLILQDLKNEMHLEDHHMGIAFVREINGIIDDKDRKESESTMNGTDSDFRALNIIVNKGFAEDIVLELSRLEIKGATIIPSYVYNLNTEETDSWRYSGRKIKEKEIVLVVTQKDKADILLKTLDENQYLKDKAELSALCENVLETVGIHYF